jgi:hypothetical protein
MNPPDPRKGEPKIVAGLPDPEEQRSRQKNQNLSPQMNAEKRRSEKI